ncbi:energy transducer TonB [Granulicella arctica]|uniref:Protein TonB n=1 Tax=Granulicella arctica TaxID=940613 RepID=A0A7Y9PJ14_9BACT|nr:energy transducer TonB [Granulicella arctica]NYF79983.1 protein TonB [Granulicella arctica]
MFEDSLFESQHHGVSPRGRWTTAASIVVQTTLASLLVAIPLLHTESLPDRMNALKLIAPTPAPPTPPRTVVQRASSAMASVVPVLGRMLTVPRITPNSIDTSPEPNTSAVSFKEMGSPQGTLLGLADSTTSPVVRVAPEKTIGPVRVSAGVSTGMLLTPIRPVYPQIAKAARVEGTVVVEAVISKTGSIESLHVVSGAAMLQSAAIDAIRAARYQPFLLNGAPVEVQTTITVNFRLGS